MEPKIATHYGASGFSHCASGFHQERYLLPSAKDEGVRLSAGLGWIEADFAAFLIFHDLQNCLIPDFS
jgi:hypothetical protein